MYQIYKIFSIPKHFCPMITLRGRQVGNFKSCFTDKETEPQRSQGTWSEFLERVNDSAVSFVSRTYTC